MWLALSLSLLAAGPAPRPTSGAIRRAFEAGKSALVEVESKRGLELGMVIGSHGEVLSRVDANQETARVHAQEVIYPAQVQHRQKDLGIALLKLDGDVALDPAAMHPGISQPGAWIVAVQRHKGHPTPLLGKLRKGPGNVFIYVDLHLTPNTPVLDLQGRLIGWAVADMRQGSRLLSIPALQARLVAPPP